jgi:hypothetical protein
VRVNSTPEKTPRKRKWNLRRDLSVLIRCSAGRTGATVESLSSSSFTRLSRVTFVLPGGARSPSTAEERPSFFLFELRAWWRGHLPRVSGNAIARKTVSVTSRMSVRIAGAAYTLSSVPPSLVCPSITGREAKYAPMGGPIQKHIANAMPTCARAFARLAGVVMSERIALWFSIPGEHIAAADHAAER